MISYKYLLLFVLLIPFAYAEEAQTFFPVSERGDETTISAFQEKWYSNHLGSMEEPSLYAMRGEKTQEVYRFTYLPTWGNPRCAVVTVKEEAAKIRFVRLDGAGGYDPGKIAERKERELTSDELARFHDLFEALDFANQSTKDPVRGMDGSQWILERLKEGEYHIVVRWTAKSYNPGKRGTVSFVELCEWMLSTASGEEISVPEETDIPNLPDQ